MATPYVFLLDLCKAHSQWPFHSLRYILVVLVPSFLLMYFETESQLCSLSWPEIWCVDHAAYKLTRSPASALNAGIKSNASPHPALHFTGSFVTMWHQSHAGDQSQSSPSQAHVLPAELHPSSVSGVAYLFGWFYLPIYFSVCVCGGGICDVCMYMYKCACPCKCVKDVHFGTSFHILCDCFCDACLSGPAGPGPWNPPLSNLQYEITGTHALPCPAFSLGSGGSELSSSCLPFTL